MIAWLGRKVLLYVLLVAGIGIAGIFAPWAKQVVAGTTPAQLRAQALGEAKQAIGAERDASMRGFQDQVRSLRGQGIAQLDARQRQLEAERGELNRRIALAAPPWALALRDRQELLENERRKLRAAVIEQELAFIAAARSAASSDGVASAAALDLAAQQRRLEQLAAACDDIVRRKAANERELRWRLGGRWIETDKHKRLVQDEANCRAETDRATQRRDFLRTAEREKARLQGAAQENLARAADRTEQIASVGDDLAASAERARVDLAGSLPERMRVWSERWGLASLLKSAAVALAAIVAMPFVIRVFCYFALAPLAMRRPSIRLRLPDAGGTGIAPASPSATSVAVRIMPGEELLVRQDYLQTTSHAGAKDTRWFLDWKKPVTSLATGLVLLTRIRGDGETTTISATRDGLAEVTIMTLPDGSGCVLQPRALAAVVLPIGRPLRITRHWRLGSLNAWLTLQLRYLVFHGPARLVLKGGRGVRVEAAEHGRVFGQDQLVGFSADLSYSVTRTETFWPYFLGREQLLKDRVMAGEGVLIVEEAPLTARRGEVRRGLEGMVDAGMKVFGM